ncbi:MAG: RiPP maturation radical SAM C-methyltransferase [Phycisphaeraceae bacterium]|nr:RiPP maturation radical SAM C-methyltransferase [Phycisphaeraceae bacterium]
MYRIALLNMPVAMSRFPSLGLTQLKAALNRELPGQVDVDIIYLNHDFASVLGPQRAEQLASQTTAVTAGLGNWLFRQAAFPKASDNRQAYLAQFERFFGSGQGQRMFEHLANRRDEFDAFLDRMIDQYALDRYDLVGFSIVSMQQNASFAMARKLKLRARQIVTVAGGPNCEAPMGQVIAKHVEAINFVFSGPSLQTLPRLVRGLLKNDLDACHAIEGVYAREKMGRYVGRCPDQWGSPAEIDQAPLLHYDDFLQSYEKHVGELGRPVLLLETSRGCWWGQKAACTFCGYNGTAMKYQAMSASRARAHIEHLLGYSERISGILAVDAIMPTDYIQTLWPVLQIPEGIHLSYEVKPVLNQEQLAVMAQAGVRTLAPGIEALASSTLRLMSKGHDAFANIRFLKDCAQFEGLLCQWQLLLGSIGEAAETYAKYLQDFPRLTHLAPPSSVDMILFYRYSQYFRRAKQYGLKLRPRARYALLYPFPEEDLKQLAYYFEDDGEYQKGYAELVPWGIKVAGAVEQWKKRWQRRDGKLAPKLEIRERPTGLVVHDSRSGEVREVPLSPLAARLLRELESPRSIPRLAYSLPETSEQQVRDCLEDLDRFGLLFVEGHRYLSLVLQPRHLSPGRGRLAAATDQEVSAVE